MQARLSIWNLRSIGGERFLKATSDDYRRGLALAFIAGLMFLAQFEFGGTFFYCEGAVAIWLCAIVAGCVLVFGSAWWARKVSTATSLALTLITWATFTMLALTQADII
jgi:hypothetical protein